MYVYCVLFCCSVIIVSELGDKTFFIAAIMAMRHARATVFSGAIAALGVMHVSIECNECIFIVYCDTMSQ